jgi:ADP-ribosylglycohydrolase
MKLTVVLTSVLGATAAQDDIVPLGDLDRRLGAIMGAAVADAAAMPLHWIYDTTSIDAKLGGKSSPKGGQRADAAFFSPPSCPFYKYPEGENSPYGQQNRVILSTLANEGSFEPTKVQDAYWAYYGPDGAPCHERQGMLPTQKKGCYWDGSTKGFVANYQAGKRWPNVGANDTQANALVHMVPLTAALAGNETALLTQVASLIRVTQNTDEAVAFGLAGARILNKVIAGAELAQAVDAVASELQAHPRMKQDQFLASGLKSVMSKLDVPNFDVVKEVGQSCDYPFNLWGGSHLVATMSEKAAASQKQATTAFMLGMRQTIEVGGDSASRSNYVGALLGAAAGESGIPSAWKEKYLHYDSVLKDAKKLLKANMAGSTAIV